MAVAETNVVHEIQMAASKRGVVLLKNVRGLFLTLDGKRRVASGLQAKGSSDLIGFRPVVITPEMVGSTLAVFCAVEVKTPTGKVSPEQRHFIDVILKNGGFAGVSRCVEDAIRVLKI